MVGVTKTETGSCSSTPRRSVETTSSRRGSGGRLRPLSGSAVETGEGRPVWDPDVKS